MFNEYYYTDNLEEPIYFSIITLNELNPTKKPSQPYNPRKLISPAIFLFVGILMQLALKNAGKFWEILSMLALIIAYFQFFSGLINKVPDRYLDDETKGKVKLISGIGSMVITQLIINRLMQ